MTPLVVPLCPACALRENRFTIQVVLVSTPVAVLPPAAELPPAPSVPPPVPAIDEVLTYSVAEAARAIGVGVPTIYRLIARRILKPIPGLRHKRLPKKQVQSYLNSTMP